MNTHTAGQMLFRVSRFVALVLVLNFWGFVFSQQDLQVKAQDEDVDSTEYFLNLSKAKITYNDFDAATDDPPIPGVKVELFQGGKFIESVLSGKKGDYEVKSKLFMNRLYKVIFSKSGYVTKTTEINTTYPAQLIQKYKKKGGAQYALAIDITLFKETAPIELQNPSAFFKFAYGCDNGDDNFCLDLPKTQKSQKQENEYRKDPYKYLAKYSTKKEDKDKLAAIEKARLDSIAKAAAYAEQMKKDAEERARIEAEARVKEEDAARAEERKRKAEEARLQREAAEAKRKQMEKLDQTVVEAERLNKEEEAKAAAQKALSEEEAKRLKAEAEAKATAERMRIEAEQRADAERKAIIDAEREDELRTNRESKHGAAGRDNPFIRMTNAASKDTVQQKKVVKK